MTSKELLIISGKGGTGKTSIAGALVELYSKSSQGVVAVDADVDAANLAILLDCRETSPTREFLGGERAVIDTVRCTVCSRCLKSCRFGAPQLLDGNVVVDQIACVGCRVCRHVCPVEAVSMRPNVAGHWLVERGDGFCLVHAELGVAQSNSGKLVDRVRNEGRWLAEAANIPMIIIDGPPGIGCPVHASLSGVDMVLVIAEPGLSGLHDLKRLLQTAGYFRRKTAVVLNKAGLIKSEEGELTQLLEEYEAPLLARLPFSREVPLALTRGKSLNTIEDFKPLMVELRRKLDELLELPHPNQP